MEDSNSIAWLCPAVSEDSGLTGKHTWQAMRMNMYIPEYALPEREAGLPPYSRETTASLEDDQDDGQNDISYSRLHLAFNPGPKGDQGFVFGWDANCDIVLPRSEFMSRRHCVLKFDDQRRPILRDISSTGTTVTYDGQGGEMRHRFTWILGGHQAPRTTELIIVEIDKYIRFRVTITEHDERPDLYIENVDLFEMGALGVRSASSSIAPTPQPQVPIRLKQETLGKGSFAVVRRVWDVSSGLEYAYKEPIDKRRFNKRAWEEEADILKQISHDHVVKLLGDEFHPHPQLALEYVPFGSLEDQKNNISDAECLTVLCQTLSALTDLHGRHQPIVHRDIKPANVLIQSRYPLFIKLTDFGLARVSNGDLKTFCGSRLYLAPEVYRGVKYTSVVDIWSLGVMVYQLAYGLPDPEGYSETRWCKFIVEKANDWESEDLIDFLSTTMLVMDPTKRGSAPYCYEASLRLPPPTQDHRPTPKPASYAEGHYAPTVVHDPVKEQSFAIQTYQSVSFNNHLIPDEATVPKTTRQSSLHEDSIRPDKNRKVSRSKAPPPESSTSRKRSTRPSTTSSSGGKHTKNKGKAAVSSGRSRPAESKSVIDLFGKGWLEDPNCVGSSVVAMGEEDPSELSSWENCEGQPPVEYTPLSIPESVYEQNNYCDPHYGGGAEAQNAHVVDAVAQVGEEGSWLNSEEYMAAHLLHALHEGD